jgi:hypothetical protein
MFRKFLLTNAMTFPQFEIFITFDIKTLQVKEDFRQLWLVLRVQSNTDLAFHYNRCLLDNIAVTWENVGGLEHDVGGLEHESAECERERPLNEDSLCNTPDGRTKSSSYASHKQGTNRNIYDLVRTGTWLRSW